MCAWGFSVRQRCWVDGAAGLPAPKEHTADQHSWSPACRKLGNAGCVAWEEGGADERAAFFFPGAEQPSGAFHLLGLPQPCKAAMGCAQPRAPS